MVHVITDRFGDQIQRIVQQKLDGKIIQPQTQQFEDAAEKVEDLFLDKTAKKVAKKNYRKLHNDELEYSEDGGESLNSSSSSDLAV